MLKYPLLAEFSKYRQIHVGVESEDDANELDLEADGNGWNMHIVAESGEMKLACLSLRGPEGAPPGTPF